MNHSKDFKTQSDWILLGDQFVAAERLDISTIFKVQRSVRVGNEIFFFSVD